MTTTKYTYEILQDAANNSVSVMGMMRYLGLKLAGGTHTHISKKVIELGVDTSHFTGQGHNKGVTSPKRLPWTEVLVFDRLGGSKQRTNLLRRAMLDSGLDHGCSRCGQGPEWCGAKLTLEVNHIDGNNLNDERSNLRFLCPNCHSQEATTNMPYRYRTAT